MIYVTRMASPIGPLLLESDGVSLIGLHMATSRYPAPLEGAIEDADAEPLATARQQLEEYFAGTRREFEVPLRLEGTPFQQRVWQQLTSIRFGETLSYRRLAEHIGNAKAMRAVGLANGRNPIALIVPCHRVIGADGSLVGFGGGLERKRWLLEHEGVRLEAERRAPSHQGCLWD
jgi:methylated-DNA-[protein]-cysteine S-methyltransferase